MGEDAAAEKDERRGDHHQAVGRQQAGHSGPGEVRRAQQADGGEVGNHRCGFEDGRTEGEAHERRGRAAFAHGTLPPSGDAATLTAAFPVADAEGQHQQGNAQGQLDDLDRRRVESVLDLVGEGSHASGQQQAEDEVERRNGAEEDDQTGWLEPAGHQHEPDRDEKRPKAGAVDQSQDYESSQQGQGHTKSPENLELASGADLRTERRSFGDFDTEFPRTCATREGPVWV